MSRITVFLWISLGLALAFVIDKNPSVSTLTGMVFAAGTALSAHWLLEGKPCA